MLTPDCGWPIRILCAVLSALPLLAVQAQEDNHLLSQVLFCQPNTLAPGLLKMFDEDQMFQYNFTNQTTSAWLHDFDQWSDQAFPNALNISAGLKLCNVFRNNLTEKLIDITPEARGGTHVTVFTTHPLRIGKPNTLICFIDDVYPPALTITWRKQGKVLLKDLDPNAYFALPDMSFQAFSSLKVTPYYDDIYSCDVQVAGDNSTIVSYWVRCHLCSVLLPHWAAPLGGQTLEGKFLEVNHYIKVPDYPVPSDVLENALCGLGVALGIVFLLLGFMFLCISKKLRDTD